jgi:hypothetical protein
MRTRASMSLGTLAAPFGNSRAQSQRTMNAHRTLLDVLDI